MDNKYTRSLVVASQKKNRNAFFQLCEIYIGAVYALCVRLTADLKVAEIITNSVFQLAWKDIKNLREKDSFQFWLRGITIYKSLEEIRNNTEHYLKKHESDEIVEKHIDFSSPLDAKFYKSKLIERLLLIFHDVEGYSFNEALELLGGFDIEKNEDILVNARKRLIGITNLECNKINLRIDHYFQNKLSEIQCSKLEAHLQICKTCNAEFNKLKEYYVQLDDLPISIDPPQNLLKTISNEIMKQTVFSEGVDSALISKENLSKLKKEKEKRDKEEKSKERKLKKVESKKKIKKYISKSDYFEKLSGRRLLYSTLGLILIAVLVYFFINSLNTTPWSIKQVKGTYVVFPHNLQLNQIDLNEKIKTHYNSAVQIDIPKTAVLHINSDTEVSIEKSDPDDAEIKLHIGRIKIDLGEKGKVLKLITKNYTITGDKSRYSCFADDLSNFLVEVEEGSVELEGKNVSFSIPEKHTYEAKFGAMKNIPLSIYASDNFKNAFENYMFKNAGDDALNAIIYESRECDGITLWHLLSVVPTNRVIDVYERLKGFYNTPGEVSKNDILYLKPDKLELWRKEIQMKIKNYSE